MQTFRLSALINFSVLLGMAVTLLVLAAPVAAHEKVLYQFSGRSDGAVPSSGLVMDAAGHLYGTASFGGDAKNCTGGCGVVFELTSTNGKWREAVLYAFHGGTDGVRPSGNLVFDSAGNLYGTTFTGGSGACKGGCGTVFELSSKRGSWTETVLYSFQDVEDGALPVGLTIDASGRLYGVTTTGGTEFGTVFELSPSADGDDAWKETTLYSFQAFEIQANPGMVFDTKGNLYGSWFQLYQCVPPNSCGTVFQLKFTDHGWDEANLFDFPGGGNGGQPMAGVILDQQGRIYGTGSDGGNNWGIAFELKRSGAGCTEKILHRFCSLNNCADGSQPEAPLVFDQAGNLYGTTLGGGTGCSYPGCGVVFKLSKNKSGWTETVLHSFKNEPTDGASPVEGLILDEKGNLFGTTPAGGAHGRGTVFEITP